MNFKSSNDPTKYFIYDLPKGESTVVFNIRSKTKGFFPLLYVVLHKNLEDNYLRFAPTELVDFYYFDQDSWDFDLYHFKQSMLFEDLPDEASLAITL